MYYILFENRNPADPLLEHVSYYYDYWMYRIGKIEAKDIPKVDFIALKAVGLDEPVAFASKFARVNLFTTEGDYARGDIIKFKASDDDIKVLYSSTEDEVEISSSGKLVYELTEEDKANTTTFLKTLMTLELDNHFSYITEEEREMYAEKRVMVQAKIDACTTVQECNLVMHDHFGIEIPNAGREEHGLDYCKWDLSELGVEMRLGRRLVNLPGDDPVVDFSTVD
jgi:hypothetical protein